MVGDSACKKPFTTSSPAVIQIYLHEQIGYGGDTDVGRFQLPSRAIRIPAGGVGTNLECTPLLRVCSHLWSKQMPSWLQVIIEQWRGGSKNEACFSPYIPLE